MDAACRVMGGEEAFKEKTQHEDALPQRRRGMTGRGALGGE